MRRTAVLVIGAALVSTACVGPSREHTVGLQQQIAMRGWDAALAHIERGKDSQYGSKNAVLYWLDKAAVLHDAGRFKESDEVLDLAEQRMEDLYTRSLSRAAATLLLNEGTEEYAGQIHERTLLYVLRALNYAYLRQPDEAAVEARKVTAFLAELNDRLGDKKLAYRDDAFAQYLSALLFEDLGRTDDARICFDASRTAYQSYASAFGLMPPPLPFGPASPAATAAPTATPAPRAAPPPPPAEPPATPPTDPTVALAPAASESGPAPGDPATGSGRAAHVGVVDATLTTPGPTPVPPQPDRPPGGEGSPGELVFLHYNGPGPRRETATVQIAWNKAMIVFQASRESRENTQAKNALIAGVAGDAVTFAYPVFAQDPFTIRDSEVYVDGARARTAVVEDVTAIARSTLAAALPAIQAKAIVRAVVKLLAARLAEQEARKRLGDGWGALAGIAARVGAAASEVADTRGWATLPAQFRLARLPVRPGTHTVTVRYFGADGGIVAEEVLQPVEVRPGRRTYVHVRTAM